MNTKQGWDVLTTEASFLDENINLKIVLKANFGIARF